VPTSAHGLVALDTDSVRDEAWNAYRRETRKQVRLAEQLRRFQTVDRPAYERWEAQVLGPLIHEARGLRAEIDRLHTILFDVEAISVIEGCSMAEAYRRLQHREANADTRQGATGRERRGEASDDTGAKGEGSETDGITLEEFRQLPKRQQREILEAFELLRTFAAFSGAHPPTFEEFLAGPPPEHPPGRNHRRSGPGADPDAEAARRVPSPKARAVERSGEVKRLYRLIVGRLHPDRNGAMGAWERDLWEQTQQAYQEADIERLEALLGLIESGDRNAVHPPKRISVSAILRMIRDAKRAMRALQQQVRSAKRHPGWGFENQGDPELRRMEMRGRRVLLEEQATLGRLLDDARAQLAALEAAAARGAKRRSRAASPMTEAAAGRRTAAGEWE